MKVKIKSLEVEMEVKQKGIELEVRENKGNKQLGDCYATMKGLTWCAGKTTKPKGVNVSWENFAVIFASKDTYKAAIKAAKAVVKQGR